jgi:hypothetical protein
MIIKYFDDFNGVWLDITGTTGTTLQFNDASGWTGVPNKVIRGNISQSGTDAPLIDEFENTTGSTFNITRVSNGQYYFDSALSLFTPNTMFITIGNNQTKNGLFSYVFEYVGDKRLNLFSYDGNTLTDEVLGNTSFEIKIY